MNIETHGAVNGDAAVQACAVSGVRHSYGGRIALNEVSLQVSKGEMVAIVGSSGAGKTTLLRVIAGMLRPDAGTVSLFGVDPYPEGNRSVRTGLVGMMQQRLDLVPQLSARHNVDAGMLGRWGLLRSVAGLFLPLRHAPTTLALARVGLDGRGEERVSRLSGGEQQRVAMARALVQDPRVLLADEPVASLDPGLAGEALELLRDIATERGRTVIASVHDPVLAGRYFDRVVGLRQGEVQFDVLSGDLARSLLDNLYRTGSGQPVDGADEGPERPPWGF